MKRDRLFEEDGHARGEFAFDADVAAVFDDMIARSVPFYGEQQRMLLELVGRYAVPGAEIHDLGCATATTLILLANDFPEAGRLIGHDNSADMLEQARSRIEAQGLQSRILLRKSDLNRPEGLRLDGAGLVLCCWTLQFVHPQRREALLRRVHDSLPAGGALLITEKVLCSGSELDDDFVDFYYAFKARSGYSRTEIQRKREALEDVLVPYRVDANVDLLHRCGFSTVELFFRWFNFAGYLCFKQDAGPVTQDAGPGSR